MTLEENFMAFLRTKMYFNSITSYDKKVSENYSSVSYCDLKPFYPCAHTKIPALLKRLSQEGKIKFEAENPTKFQKYKIRVLTPGPICINSYFAKSRPPIIDNAVFQYMIGSLKLVSMEMGNYSSHFQIFLGFKQSYASHFFRVSKFSGRVFTPICCLKKDQRAAILLDGNETCSLDVATMQPLILARILLKKIGDNEFTQAIYNGADIYMLLKEKLSLKSRDEAKTKYYQLMYGKHDTSKQFPIGGQWLQWINHIKCIKLVNNPNTINKPHSNLSWMLQKSEVMIMTKVWEQLKDRNIPFLSIHDEIIVAKTQRLEAIQVLSSVLSVYFPYFKINE